MTEKKFQDAVLARFDSLGKRLDGVDERFDRIDERLDRTDKRFDAIDERLDKQGQILSAVAHHVGAMRKELIDLRTFTMEQELVVTDLLGDKPET